MNNFEAFLYSIINQIDMIVSTPYAMVHTFFLSPIYTVQLIIWVFKAIFKDDKDGRGKGGRGGQGGSGNNE
jgi:hypothetical protein